MTQPCNYVNFVERIQAAIDMMPFDVGNKMRNGAGVVGWSLLGESTEITRPFFFCCSLSYFKKSSNSLLGSCLRISLISVTLLSISTNNASIRYSLFFLDSWIGTTSYFRLFLEEEPFIEIEEVEEELQIVSGSIECAGWQLSIVFTTDSSLLNQAPSSWSSWNLLIPEAVFAFNNALRQILTHLLNLVRVCVTLYWIQSL